MCVCVCVSVMVRVCVCVCESKAHLSVISTNPQDQEGKSPKLEDFANFLAFDGILLVGKGELDILKSKYDSFVIQRCSRGEIVAAIDAEFDVLEFERFASSLARSFDVLGGAQEPEVGNDDEVDDMGVEGPPLGVLEVQAVEQGFDDADVGGVGTSTWVVFVAEGSEESSE